MTMMRRMKLLVFAVVLVVALTPVAPVSALSWITVTVDAPGAVGVDTSIAAMFLTTQRIHISYRDITNGNLKHAYWDQIEGVWIKETVDSVGDVGKYTAIALDSSGNPHISYYDVTNGNLKYAKKLGTSWSIETVDSAGNVGQYTAIALDSSGNPHISYYDVTNGNLKYAKKVGTSWSLETVDSAGFVGRFTSIALTGSTPHISYFDVTNGDLKYAKKVGTSWSIETVDSAGSVGQFSSLALTPPTGPGPSPVVVHISYYDATSENLKYAKKVGAGSWSIETVDAPGNVGIESSIVVDSSGTPHISYHDGANGDLKYAKKMGTSWSIETVDSAGFVGDHSSIALDFSGNPLISYFDATNGNLKFARGSPPTFRYAVIVDLNSYSIEPSDFTEVANAIRSKLLERAGVQAVLVDWEYVMLTEAQRTSNTLLQSVMDDYVLAHLDLRLNGLVLYTKAPAALSFGGFQLNTSDLSSNGYCNAFDSPVLSGERAYGGVMDWEHRFARCGSEPPTDPDTCSKTSVPAGSGFCRNQASACVWNPAGYCMCANVAGLPYADVPTFLGRLIIHEWMHSFGKYGNFDHYCAQTAGSGNDCVDEMMARGEPLDCGSPMLLVAAQESCGICPYTFDNLAASHRSCP